MFFLFFLLLPTQLGKHFFPAYAFVGGVRIDYLDPTVYLSDIFAAILIFANLRTAVRILREKKILVLLLFLLASVTTSLSPYVSLYRYAKIIEWLLVFAVFCRKAGTDLPALTGIFAGAATEFLLSFLQFYQRHAVQGIFYWLGERDFSVSTPGIAKAAVQGVEFLRPYGTFSHPNSLGGFYLLVYFFVLQHKKFGEYRLLKTAVLILSSLLVFFSFSRTAILAYIGLNIAVAAKNAIGRKNICLPCLLSKIAVAIVLCLVFLSFKTDPLSLGKRIVLIRDSFLIILQRPLLGTGPGSYLLAQKNFPNPYPYFFLQPVHNIFLLFPAEAGIPAAVYLLFLIAKARKKIAIDGRPVLILAVAVTGLFDHYWLTLQQNWLLLAAVIGMIF